MGGIPVIFGSSAISPCMMSTCGRDWNPLCLFRNIEWSLIGVLWLTFRALPFPVSRKLPSAYFSNTQTNGYRLLSYIVSVVKSSIKFSLEMLQAEVWFRHSSLLTTSATSMQMASRAVKVKESLWRNACSNTFQNSWFNLYFWRGKRHKYWC